MIPPALFFFLEITLAIWGLLWSHANFRIISSYVKNAIGILIGTALNWQIALGRMDVLTIPILPTQEHSMSFHLFIYSIYLSFHSIYLLYLLDSIFFIKSYRFQSTVLSLSWLYLFQGILSGCNYKWDFFLISLSDSLLLQGCNQFLYINFLS